MKEIRLHGRGGQGTVKASEIIVWAAVRGGLYANSIPYFGFERRGAPVSAFVRMDAGPIRPKTQVYHPDCVVVMDETLKNAVDIFEGVKPGSILVINTKRDPGDVPVPHEIARVAAVDATGVSLRLLGRAIPNTVMLGAFARATGWVDLGALMSRAEEVFGAVNAGLVEAGHEATRVADVGRVGS